MFALECHPSIAGGLLRARSAAIAAAWIDDVRTDAPELARLGDLELRAPLDAMLDALADHLDGRPESVAQLSTIANAHASRRLRRGVELGVLLAEYARLRVCLHAALTDIAPLTPIDCAIDQLAALAAVRYHNERELQRERLVGVLAHDLRSPVTCIGMACDLLLASQHAPHQRPLIDQIANAADRMHRMVADVLIFARAQLGDDLPIAPEAADLGEIVRSAIEEMRTIHGDHAVAAEIDRDLRGLFDRDRVYQLVTNLLRNAVEHGAGSVFVRAHAASDAREVVLVVRNRRATHLAPPVDPSRHNRSTSMRGLGLYIVDQIARAHGAHVELAATDNDMTVTVRWPVPARTERA